MTRRRRRDVVVFELEDGPDAPSPPPDESGSAPRRHMTPAQARRQLVAGVSVLVVALGAWGTLSVLRDREHDARLSAAPGGVISLEPVPSARWTVDTDSAGDELFLPGLVVVRQETQLVGIDAADGTQRWRVEVGGDPQCGPTGGWRTAVVATRLVCWSGPDAARSTVVVISPDGTPTTRELTETYDAIAPAAGGGLVTARRVGPEPPPPAVVATPIDAGGYSLTGSIDEGQDAVVRLADAATGEVRWEHTVPFRPVASAAMCANVVDDEEGGFEVDVDHLDLAVTARLITLTACGLRADLTNDGQPVGDPAASAWSWVEPYGEGGYLEHVSAYAGDPAARVLLYDEDGHLVGTFASPLLNPWATDGEPGGIRLAGSFGLRMRAYDESGEELWRSSDSATDLLVRAAGTAVVTRDDGSLAAIDLDNGRMLWTQRDLLRSSDDSADWAGAGRVVQGAFTDGETALLAVASFDDPTVELVALDLATGAVRWRTDTPANAWFVSVDGRLVERVVPDSADLRPGSDGTTVRYSTGTVSVLD